MPSYDDSVFINCPFDEGYRPLFEAIVFAVYDCGFIPRGALEVDDSGQVRILKIEQIIAECRLGIHDISRTELDPHLKLPRFNMPLELSLFLGAKRYGDRIQKRKSCKILDTDRYRFQKFCSDIAGQDISAHSNKIDRAIRAVRDWLRSCRPKISIPSGSKISQRFHLFNNDLPLIARHSTSMKMNSLFLIFKIQCLNGLKQIHGSSEEECRTSGNRRNLRRHQHSGVARHVGRAQVGCVGWRRNPPKQAGHWPK